MYGQSLFISKLIFKTSCLFIIVITVICLNGCKTIKEFEIVNQENTLIIVGEIHLENPVLLFIKKGKTTLELITTRKNAELYANKPR